VSTAVEYFRRTRGIFDYIASIRLYCLQRPVMFQISVSAKYTRKKAET